MSEEHNFFNLDAADQGIARQLADGMTTRVFPGDDAMISVVRIEPNKSGIPILTRRNNGAFASAVQDCAAREARKFMSVLATSGALPAGWSTALPPVLMVR